MGAFDWLYRLNLKQEDRDRLDRVITLIENLTNNKEVEIRISVKDKTPAFKTRSPR